MTLPFFKSAGGKREVVPAIRPLLRPFGRYWELFTGAGALALALGDEGLLTGGCVLNDANSAVAALWEAVRLPHQSFTHYERYMQHMRWRPYETYYALRNRWNERLPEHEDQRASVQLFLRKHCFNGIWRENRRGEFNVPWNKKLADLDWAVLEAVAQWMALVQPILRQQDFEQAEPTSGDLVYVDPPYYGGWVGYTAAGWQWADFLRLLDACARWSRSGVQVVLSHSVTPEVQQALKEHWPSARIEQIMVARSANAKGSGRAPVPELLAFS